jgi:hypothetical protein
LSGNDSEAERFLTKPFPFFPKTQRLPLRRQHFFTGLAFTAGRKQFLPGSMKFLPIALFSTWQETLQG